MSIHYKTQFTLILLLLVTTPFFAGRSRKKNSSKKETAVEKKIIEKTFLIDVTGSLFTEDTSSFVSKVGFGSITRFTLTNWKSPVDSCLDLLDKMSNEKEYKTAVPFNFRGRTMPSCIIEWQQGEKKHQDVQKELDTYICKLDKDGYFRNDNEKYVTQTILNISLNPNELAEITKPITKMVDLIKELKEKGYKLYGVANLSHESFEVLKKTHPELVKLFDGITISAEINSVKPNQKIFDHMIKTYNINPKYCIAIDNQEECIPVLEKLGITAIYYSTPKATINQLKKLGIV